MRISDWSSDVCSSDLREFSSYDLLRAEATLAECAVPTAVPRLDIVPAIVDLSGAEIELVEFQDRLHRLQKALASAEAGQWDICLIDRSEERRVGKECVSPRRSRWSPSH